MLISNLSLDKSDLNPYIWSTLLKKIEQNLKENKKIILYLNKRWNFSSLICTDCQYLYKCDNCDVALTVHRYPEKLSCHICWVTKNIPLSCKKCAGNNLKKIWVWTQQIEESLNKYFSESFIFRFDLDSVKNKTDKKQALENLEKADIIIGTKMITTGFDFKSVWLIWVILIEQELSFPFYNTEEKAYINIKQLLGRWERMGEKTDFVLQTFIPENNLIKIITEMNYKDFFIETLNERKLFNYPPFTEIAILEYRDKNQTKAFDFMQNLKNKLDILNNQKNFEIILNKEAFKKYNQYYFKIVIKWDNLREFLKNIKKEIFKNSNLSLSFS